MQLNDCSALKDIKEFRFKLFLVFFVADHPRAASLKLVFQQGKKMLRHITVFLTLFLFSCATSVPSKNSELTWQPSGINRTIAVNMGWTGFKRMGYEYHISEEGVVSIQTPSNAGHQFGENFPPARTDDMLGEMMFLCSYEFGSQLAEVITKPRKVVFFEAYYYPKIAEGQCVSRQAYQRAVASEEKWISEWKQAAEIAATDRTNSQRRQNAQILTERKESCTTYGFTPGTDGHSKCVMELAIAADASEKQRISNANRAAALAIQAAAANATSEAAEDARKQRRAQALINLGSSISSDGAPYRSSTPSPTAPVSSGRYKTCSYRVAGEIVTMTVSRAEACSATKLIGGQTGYLVR
jgi:hypothetical protein